VANYFLSLSLSLRLVLSDNGKVIFCVHFRTVVVSGVKKVTGMAVDWISKNLYWVDREKVRIRLAIQIIAGSRYIVRNVF